jgi:hypothetical protein
MSEQIYNEDFQGENESSADEAESAIREAFDEAIQDESGEDDIKLQMISAGATFKNVTRLYNKFMVEAGLAISKSDRNQIVEDTLSGRDVSTEESFNEAVNALVASIQGATERSAASLVRAYAKKNELPVYAKPKSEGGMKVGFASKFYDFLVGNPSVTEAEAEAFIMGKDGHAETSDNVKNHLSHYQAIRSLANRIAAA